MAVRFLLSTCLYIIILLRLCARCGTDTGSTHAAIIHDLGIGFVDELLELNADDLNDLGLKAFERKRFERLCGSISAADAAPVPKAALS